MTAEQVVKDGHKTASEYINYDVEDGVLREYCERSFRKQHLKFDLTRRIKLFVLNGTL